MLLQQRSVRQQEPQGPLSPRTGSVGHEAYLHKDRVKAGVALFNSPWRERLVWTRKIRKSCIWKVVYKLVLKDMDHLKKKGMEIRLKNIVCKYKTGVMGKTFKILSKTRIIFLHQFILL